MLLLPENTTTYLIGADYSGQKKTVRLIFYEAESKKLYSWYGEDHDPYCLTNLSPFELEKISQIMKHPNLKKIELITKFDALKNEEITVTKIIVEDPKAIGGGKPSENIRDIIPTEGGGKVWEAKIPYSSCYLYDKNIEMGMPYIISDKKLNRVVYSDAEDRIKQITEKVQVGNDRWVRLCEYPVPEFLRCALDIEVLGAERTRVPDPTKAEYPVISVCLIGTDGKKKVLLLLRENIEIGTDEVNADLQFFSTEIDLLKVLFMEIKNYPFIITFNGDNFDLPYLYYRALKLGIPKEEIPILITRHGAKIKDTIHIDLYRFFFNRSLRNYAFSGKYKNVALDEIALALLGKGKLHSNENIWLATEMRGWTYTQLAKYNCQDGDVTLELTTYDESLVMKLIVILMRISMMSMEDLIRSPISFWIRGMLFYEHRRRNILIPNPEDILLAKGKAVTEAVIKGKKYKGAIVIEPSAGIHFNVDVLDFASLYPSILKEKNLGYASIRCKHVNDWDLINDETKKLIYWLCHYYLYDRSNQKCQAEELMRLMKNIELDVKSTQETIVSETKIKFEKYKELLIKKQDNRIQKNSEGGEEKHQEDITSGIEKNIMNTKDENIENYKSDQKQTQNLQKNLDINIIRQESDIHIENELNSTITKEIDAIDAPKQIIELLKSITWMEEKKEEIVPNLLMKIGIDLNYFVPIATKLNILRNQSCKSNTIPETSHWVCKKIKSMEGEIIGLLRDLRVFHYKKLKKDPYYGVVEQAIKVFLNAAYGVFGDEGFDLYCPPISESVTAMGRHSISSTIEKAKELGITILYGDTDSIFLQNPTKEQLESLTKWSTQTLGLDLEVDKHYRYVCLSSRKKNYLGVQPSGEIDVKGLTGKKKHTPPIIKDAFNMAKKYFGNAQTPEEVEALKNALKKVILDIYLRIKRRDFTLEEVAFNMTLGKSLISYEKTIPQHVKAAKILEELGIFLKKGDAVFFVKCHRKEVKPIQLAKKEDVDIIKYHEMLKSTFEQVLDALDIDWDKIIGVMKLEQFW